MEDNLEQTKEEIHAQKEEIKPREKMIKTKILGIVLLFFTVLWTFLSIYEFLTFGTEITSFHVPIFVFSYIVGIALIMIKKRGIYHKLIVLCGIILLAFYVFILGLLSFIS